MCLTAVTVVAVQREIDAIRIAIDLLYPQECQNHDRTPPSREGPRAPLQCLVVAVPVHGDLVGGACTCKVSARRCAHGASIDWMSAIGLPKLQGSDSVARLHRNAPASTDDEVDIVAQLVGARPTAVD